MFLAHVVNEFIIQPFGLGNLKRVDYWWKWGKYQDRPSDFLVALILHSISWSSLISLPILFIGEPEPLDLVHLQYMFFFLVVSHFVIELLEVKAEMLNLWWSQGLYLIQILLLYEICA
jgi:hypothetical protein